MEFAISPLFLPYRCSICDRREFKFRFIDMNPDLRREVEDEPEVEEAETPGEVVATSPKKPKSGKKK